MMEQPSGITRKLDDLGRIVLPVEIRRSFGLNEGDYIDIAVSENRIVLRKIEPACIFCGGAGDLVEHHNKPVCLRCRTRLAESI